MVVAEAAARLNADIVICGDHRRSPVRDVFRSTTVERIVQFTGKPILIARGHLNLPYSEVLVGLEGGEVAEAIDVLDSIGSQGGIRVVHVVDPIEAGMMFSVGIDRDRIADYRKEAAAEAERRILGGLDPALRSRIGLEVVNGSPAEALLEMADRTEVDLIVTATHARRGIARSILGSVTGELIRRGKTDHLIVPRFALGRRP